MKADYLFLFGASYGVRGETKLLENRNGNVELKRAVGEQIWLHYYNRVLFEAGLISEQERNRMSNRINGRVGLAREKGNSARCR